MEHFTTSSTRCYDLENIKRSENGERVFKTAWFDLFARKTTEEIQKEIENNKLVEICHDTKSQIQEQSI